MPAMEAKALLGQIALHQEWLCELAGSSSHERGRQLDLSEQRVVGILIEGKDLRSTVLNGAQLVNMTFLDCDFSSSEAVGAQLRDCSFRSCRFHKADFRGSKLERCELFQCELTRVDFTEATIADCRILYSRLDGAWLIASDFSGSVITSTTTVNVKMWETKGIEIL